jgi:6-phosphogluconolactonase (cycloisomerase 2 family)
MTTNNDRSVTDGANRARPRRHWLSRVVKGIAVCLVFATPAVGSILVVFDVLFNGQDGVQGLQGASAVAISPNGDNIYAVGALDDAISVFSRNPQTGELAFVEVHQDGVSGVDDLRSPTDVAVSPDGRHVYVTSDLDDALTVFRRTSSGRLSFVGSYVSGVNGVWGIGGASAVSLNHDGSLVFVTGGLEDSLAVFSRNPSSNQLVLADVESSHDGASGLVGASDVSVSPDGRHVYATSDIDNAIAIFAKDPTQDAVAFVDWLHNGSNGVSGLNGASAIAIDHSGSHVFVTGRLSNALAVFARDIDSGLLQQENIYTNSQAAVSGLGGASDVALDRSSELVCVTGSTDHSVAVFRRAADSADLEWIEVVENGQTGVAGLAGASSLVASPDGRFLYVTASVDDALVTIETTTNLFADGFESGDIYGWISTFPVDSPP